MQSQGRASPANRFLGGFDKKTMSEQKKGGVIGGLFGRKSQADSISMNSKTNAKGSILSGGGSVDIPIPGPGPRQDMNLS